MFVFIGLPLLSALCWQLLLAFGAKPAVAMFALDLRHIMHLLQQPALYRSTLLSIGCATVTTLLAMGIVLLVVCFSSPSDVLKRYCPWIALLLSIPHLAFVIGWQFVIAPSGFLFRLFAPLVGMEVPPSFASVPDPWFIGYIVLLAMKESSFLLMLVLINVPQIGAEQYYRSTIALGYNSVSTWCKVLAPLLYPRIRLGMYVLFVYAATNIEIAFFAAPNIPELMSLRVMQWYNHSDLDYLHLGAAGGIWLIVMVGISLCLWRVSEKSIAMMLRTWQCNNYRGGITSNFVIARFIHYLYIGCFCVPLVLLACWSVSQSWVFPDIVPSRLSLRWWANSQTFLPMLRTLIIAAISAGVVLVLAIVYAKHSPPSMPIYHQLFLYTPLLIPQLACVGGLAVLAHVFTINGTYIAVIFAHIFLTLPYAVLILTPIYKRYDNRYIQAALVLGHSPLRIWLTITLPLLARPILFCFALAISVSVSLYLPTVLLGEGRIVTLMSEMVDLGTSYDRRKLAVLSLWLVLIPLFAFTFVGLRNQNSISQLHSAN